MTIHNLHLNFMADYAGSLVIPSKLRPLVSTWWICLCFIDWCWWSRSIPSCNWGWYSMIFWLWDKEKMIIYPQLKHSVSIKARGGYEHANSVPPNVTWLTGRCREVTTEYVCMALSCRTRTYGNYTSSIISQAPASRSMVVKDIPGPPKFSAFPFKYFS